MADPTPRAPVKGRLEWSRARMLARHVAQKARKIREEAPPGKRAGLLALASRMDRVDARLAEYDATKARDLALDAKWRAEDIHRDTLANLAGLTVEVQYEIEQYIRASK